MQCRWPSLTCVFLSSCIEILACDSGRIQIIYFSVESVMSKGAEDIIPQHLICTLNIQRPDSGVTNSFFLYRVMNWEFIEVAFITRNLSCREKWRQIWAKFPAMILKVLCP